MTHIVEHRSLRYTWELVRHTYLVDLESEIEIRQVEISPSHENRLHDPPYQFTPFFEIEIDQIQKNGSTVFSLRNICPVEMNGKPGWNLLNSLIKTGGPRVTKRFQSLEGETETRWLYTDDFFLISLSSGDRHDLSMLLSLIINKLNMIALSTQSGRRIRSEFENQEKFRATMSTMFSEGVDGAFRDVPVYMQHGDMTGSEIDVSAALMSAELQDLTAACASDEGAASTIPVTERAYNEPAAEGNPPEESPLSDGKDPEPAACERFRDENPPVSGAGSVTPAGFVPDEGACAQTSDRGFVLADSIPEDHSQEPVMPGENTRVQPLPGGRCSSCGGEISSTTKFCGSCGAAVCPVPENSTDLSRTATGSGSDSYPPRSRPAAEPAVNLKSIEELEDLSWLSD